MTSRSNQFAEDHGRSLQDRLPQSRDGGIERLDDCFGKPGKTRVEHERFLQQLR